MASDAIAVLRGYGLRKPMLLLAESGAVKPVHTGSHPIYKVDTMGSVLHDDALRPLFQRGRRAGGTSGIGITISTSSIPGSRWGASRVPSKVSTPLREGFRTRAPRYGGAAGLCAAGRTHADCLVPRYGEYVAARASERIPAQRLSGLQVDFTPLLGGRRVKKVRIYDPWRDEWVRASRRADVSLPDFTRSVVVRIEY